jgi:hypothetical protein
MRIGFKLIQALGLNQDEREDLTSISIWFAAAIAADIVPMTGEPRPRLLW